MKWLLLILLFFDLGPLNKISKENQVKTEAEEAFKRGDYKTAADRYQYLSDSLKITDEHTLLNLAHAIFNLKELGQAAKVYEKLYSSTDGRIRSVAAQQLGVISYKGDKDKAKALVFFKEALKANPHNEQARYNFEYLKKLQEKKEDPKIDNKKDKNDNKDQKNQEPSAFAKRLKEQAEALCAARKYTEAYNLMVDGMKKDQSVSIYQDFIQRIKKVAEINSR